MLRARLNMNSSNSSLPSSSDRFIKKKIDLLERKVIEEAGILPKFNGILSHDCWYAYDCYPQIVHSLCWAHFLRELQSIEENTNLEFPAKIREFILNLKEKVEKKEEFSSEEEINIWLKYMALIEDGK